MIICTTTFCTVRVYLFRFRNVALPMGRHPLIHMPVFIMGIITGLQTLREDNNDSCTDPNLHISSCRANSDDIMEDERRKQTWARRVFRTVLIYLAAIIFLSMPQRQGAPKELRLLIRSYLFLDTKLLLIKEPGQ